MENEEGPVTQGMDGSVIVQDLVSQAEIWMLKDALKELHTAIYDWAVAEECDGLEAAIRNLKVTQL